MTELIEPKARQAWWRDGTQGKRGPITRCEGLLDDEGRYSYDIPLDAVTEKDGELGVDLAFIKPGTKSIRVSGAYS